MIDLTPNIDLAKPKKTRTILTCFIALDRELILEILKAKSIFINGHYYKVPENKLIEILFKKQSGILELELTKMKTNKL